MGRPGTDTHPATWAGVRPLATGACARAGVGRAAEVTLGAADTLEAAVTLALAAGVTVAGVTLAGHGGQVADR